MSNWVNTVVDSTGNPKIGIDATRGQASLGDRESKRVVCDYQYPNHVGLTAGSKAKKEESKGQ